MGEHHSQVENNNQQTLEKFNLHILTLISPRLVEGAIGLNAAAVWDIMRDMTGQL